MKNKDNSFFIRIKDSLDNYVELGDDVCLELPETEVIYGYDDCVYGCAKKVYGKLSLRLSCGIGIKIEYIDMNKELEEYDQMPIIKNWISLKRTKYKWYRYGRKSKIKHLLK